MTCASSFDRKRSPVIASNVLIQVFLTKRTRYFFSEFEHQGRIGFAGYYLFCRSRLGLFRHDVSENIDIGEPFIVLVLWHAQAEMRQLAARSGAPHEPTVKLRNGRKRDV